MVTIKDVAKKAGVSASTVSRVLNHSAPVASNKCHAVRHAIASLDYQPNAHAQALVRRCSNTIGYISGENLCTKTLQCVEKITANENKQLSVRFIRSHQLMGNPINLIKTMESYLSARCDAFIVQEEILTDAQWVTLLSHFPSTVLLGRKISVFANRCVYPNFVDIGYRITEHFINLGHKSIAWIGQKNKTSSYLLLKEGYLQALRKNNALKKSVIIDTTESDAIGGYTASKNLLQNNHAISAIITMNNDMATGVLKALSEANKKVPYDISLFSCNMQPATKHYLPSILSSAIYPVEEMAQCAIQLALALAANKKNAYPYLPPNNRFQAKMDIQDSVMPPTHS